MTNDQLVYYAFKGLTDEFKGEEKERFERMKVKMNELEKEDPAMFLVALGLFGAKLGLE